MKEDDEMSERDRALAEHVAQAVMARILQAATSDEVAEKVINTWGGTIDKILGRALLRLGLYLVIFLIGLGSIKLGLLDKFQEFLKP